MQILSFVYKNKNNLHIIVKSQDSDEKRVKSGISNQFWKHNRKGFM